MKIKKILVFSIIISMMLLNVAFVSADAVFTITMTNPLKDISVSDVFEFEASNDIRINNIDTFVNFVDESGEKVEADVEVSGKILTITPKADLKEATRYNITFHDALCDVNGNPIMGQKSFTVSTVYPEEIIVDLDSPGHTASGGAVSSNAVKGYQDRKCMYGVTSVKYMPQLPAEGTYKVYFWNVDWTGMPTEVSTEVYADGQTIVGPIMDLTASRGNWIEIGTFQFKGSGDEYLKVNKPDRCCCAKFEYIKEDKPLIYKGVVYPENLSAVSTDLDIVLQFDDAADLSSFGNTYIESESETIGVIAYMEDKNSVKLKTERPLKINTQYTLELDGVRNLDGEALENSQSIPFTTRGYYVKSPYYWYDGNILNIKTEVDSEAVLLSAWTDSDGYVTDISASNKEVGELNICLGENQEAETLNTFVFADMSLLKPVDRKEIRRSITLNKTDFNDEQKIIKVSAEIDNPIRDSHITAVMLKRGEEEITAENIQYIKEIVTSESFVEFEFALKPETVGGAYNIYVGGTGIDELLCYNFYYITDETIEAARVALNDASDASEIENVIREQKKELGLDDEFFNIFTGYANLSDKDSKDSPYTEIISAMQGKDFKTVEEASNAFSKSVMLAYLKRENSSAIKDMTERRGSVLNVYFDKDKGEQEECLVLPDYKKLDSTDIIYINLHKTAFDTESEFKERLECEYAIALLDAAAWGEIESIIEKYNKYFLLDLTKYKNLSASAKQNAMRSMANADLSDLNKIKNTYDQTVTNQRNNNSGSTGGGNGGGGSIVKTPSSLKVDADAVGNKTAPEIIYQEDTRKTNMEFNDLEEVSWAQEAIEELTANGVISGYGNGKFGPNDSVTREQFVKMIVKAFNILNLEASSSFSDVSKDDWSYYYISSAFNVGIINGINDQEFGKEKEITRQEMAVMLNRTLKYLEKSLPKNNTLVNFKDAESISDYAVDAIEALYEAGIMTGVGDDMFAPTSIATRAMAAKIVKMSLDL